MVDMRGGGGEESDMPFNVHTTFKYVCYMQVEGLLSFLCYSSHTCYRSRILTFSCLPAIEHVPNSSLGTILDISAGSSHFVIGRIPEYCWTVADIL